MAHVPLTSRPLDLLYFVFFLIHLPASSLIDLQALYPPHLVPRIIAQLPELYVSMSNDPLIGGALGYFGPNHGHIWFKSFLTLEAFFQVPVFILGMRGLLNNSRSIYLLLLIYAASTATTTLPCLMVIITTPLTSPETIAANILSVTAEQKLLLLSSYIPFFLLPLGMTIDMAYRISGLMSASEATRHSAKTK